MKSSRLHSTGVRVVFVLSLVGMLALPASIASARSNHAVSRAVNHAVKTGGNVVAVGGPVSSWTQNFNPINGANASNYGTQGLIYEPLVYFNGMSGKATPWLAKSYKWTNGAKTLTFTIRPGVKWTDGKAFTAADVLYSADIAIKYKSADPGMDLFLRSSKPVTMSGSKVSFHFKAPNSTMLYYVGFTLNIVPKHIFSHYSNPTTSLNFPPVGTGPFVMKSSNFSPEKYTLTKNPHYWQMGKPYIASISYPAYSSNADIEADLIKGKIQWGGAFVPNAQQTLVKCGDCAKGNFYWYAAANNPMCLFLNDTKLPFSDVNIRRAISQAIDRNVIWHQGEYGYETPSNAGFVQPQFMSKWADKSILNGGSSQYALSADGNATKAQSFFNAASSQAQAAAKQPLYIDVEYGWSDWDASALLMASELNSVLGMNVKVNQLDFPDPMPTSTLHTGNFDMGLSWTSSGVPSPYPIYHDWFWSNYKQPVGSDAIGNWERYSNSTLDGLITGYALTTSTASQVAKMKKMEDIAASDVPIVPVVTQALWYEGNSSKFTGFPTQSKPYDLGPAFEARWMEDVALHLHLK
jgi:peptide/nickel transport system substrate-binding protein